MENRRNIFVELLNILVETLAHMSCEFPVGKSLRRVSKLSFDEIR